MIPATPQTATPLPVPTADLWRLVALARVAEWRGRREGALHPALHPALLAARTRCEALAPGLTAAALARALLEAERRGQGVALPLARAARGAALPLPARLALVLAAEAIDTPDLGEALAGPDFARAPRGLTVAVAGAAFGDGPAAGAAIADALEAAGLAVREPSEAAPAEQVLRSPAPVRRALSGGPIAAPGIALLPRGEAPPLDALPYPADFLAALARLPMLFAEAAVDLLLLRAGPGDAALAIARAVAAACGRDLLVAAEAGQEAARLAGALALLADAMPFHAADPAPGETLRAPAFGQGGRRAILSLGAEGGIDPEGRRMAALSAPEPGPALRRRAWAAALRRAGATAAPATAAAAAARFAIAPGWIGRAAAGGAVEARLAGRTETTPRDIRRALRQIGRESLDGLAEPLEPDGCWADLVLGPATRAGLDALAARCAQRATAPGGPGVRALFAGPSGAGKTMAARVLAAETGMDLYRVDLAATVSKYVGETEKNLSRLLTRAEALDVILLIDEGDALLARRTEVKSSNDRFANLETNYLLQRLERHRGVVVAATNLPESVDGAFQRRLDVVVRFSRPDAPARAELWRSLLPQDAAVDAADIDEIARRCALTGGQIRNAVHAALSLALDEGGLLDAARLREAVRREHAKAGAACPLSDATPPVRRVALGGAAAVLRAGRSAP